MVLPFIAELELANLAINPEIPETPVPRPSSSAATRNLSAGFSRSARCRLVGILKLLSPPNTVHKYIEEIDAEVTLPFGSLS